jgi:hypothetical protein
VNSDSNAPAQRMIGEARRAMVAVRQLVEQVLRLHLAQPRAGTDTLEAAERAALRSVGVTQMRLRELAALLDASLSRSDAGPSGRF